jgi:phosphotransferase system HPr (HPr) family protein
MKPTDLARRLFVVNNPNGIHLRAAVMLAKTANRFKSTITVHRNGKSADVASPLSTVLLEATFGRQVTVMAEGDDADLAMEAIANLFMAGLK